MRMPFIDSDLLYRGAHGKNSDYARKSISSGLTGGLSTHAHLFIWLLNENIKKPSTIKIYHSIRRHEITICRSFLFAYNRYNFSVTSYFGIIVSLIYNVRG